MSEHKQQPRPQRGNRHNTRRRQALPDTVTAAIPLARRVNMPAPLRMRDIFDMRFSGYIPIGALTPAGWGTGSVPGVIIGLNWINSITSTFGPLANGAAVVRLTTAANSTVIGATNLSTPLGFRNFFATVAGSASLYQRYVVTAVDYAITFVPQALGDTVVFVVVPEIGLPTGLQTNSNYASLFAAAEAPFSQYKVTTATNTVSDNCVRGRVDIAQFLGIPREQLLVDNVYSGFNNDNASTLVLPTTNVILGFYAQTMDGAANAAVLVYDVKLKYHVTLMEPSTATLIG
jgi:hypothetical protein